METSAEEKKELEARRSKDFSDGDSDSDVDVELVDLPPQLSALKDRTYEFWEDLENDVRERKCADLNIVIDPDTSRARWRITKGAHELITDLFVADFRDYWGKNRWTAAAESSSVLIQPQVPGGKVTLRKPDIAYWGFPKCTTTVNRRGKLLARKMNPPPSIVPPKQSLSFAQVTALHYERNRFIFDLEKKTHIRFFKMDNIPME